MAAPDRPTADHSRRRVVLLAAFGLLAMALLAPFAQFGVLGTLVVPGDAAASANNIAASAGLFRAAIAAFLIVAILDVVVAWAFTVLLRPVDGRLALVVGWLRVVYGVVFALVLLNLMEVARLLGGTDVTAAQSLQVQSQVAASIAAFERGWHLALGIFGLHLVGLGALLMRYVAIPRFLAALVILAGAGYLADALGTMLVPGYALTISSVTFVGEALLIVWLFRIAITGVPADRPAVSPAPKAVRAAERTAA